MGSDLQELQASITPVQRVAVVALLLCFAYGQTSRFVPALGLKIFSFLVAAAVFFLAFKWFSREFGEMGESVRPSLRPGRAFSRRKEPGLMIKAPFGLAALAVAWGVQLSLAHTLPDLWTRVMGRPETLQGTFAKEAVYREWFTGSTFHCTYRLGSPLLRGATRDYFCMDYACPGEPQYRLIPQNVSVQVVGKRTLLGFHPSGHSILTSLSGS